MAEYMIINKISDRVKEFVSNFYEVEEECFKIDDVLYMEHYNKIFFFVLPSDFDFMETIGLSYVIVPGPIMYDTIKDSLTTIDPNVFNSKYGNNIEYINSKKE